MGAFYNDNDRFASAWLRELMADGLIMEGEVDERGIEEITGEDVKGFERVHLFAGIGGWDYALSLAGWEGPVWTGSCPCQPFSVAGRGRGTEDPRHLWPQFRRLIAECHPPTVFGEQVASKDGRKWLSGVRADLEDLGYSVGAADLCAAGVQAPQPRQRLWWVADAHGSEFCREPSTRDQSDHREDESPCRGMADTDESIRKRPNEREPHARTNGGDNAGGGGNSGRMANTEDSDGRGASGAEDPRGRTAKIRGSSRGSKASSVHLPEGMRLRESRRGEDSTPEQRMPRTQPIPGAGGGVRGPCSFWERGFRIPCADGKFRRIPSEPALFPLAPRLPGRVGLLRGSGNSIIPQVAAEFVRAYMELSSTTIKPND